MLHARRARIAAGFGALLAIAAIVSNSVLIHMRAEQRWADLRSRGVLRIGIDSGVARFSIAGPQGWMGFDAEVAHALGTRLGLRIEPVPVGYDGLYDAITTGTVDVSMSAMPPDPTRAGTFAFSQPYFDAGARLVGEGVAHYRTLDDLRHSRVAVARGSEGDRAALHLERRIAGFMRVPHDDNAAALATMAHGRANWALIEGISAAAGPCRAVEDPPGEGRSGQGCIVLQPQPYVLAMRVEDTRLLVEIDHALASMQADGTLDALWRKLALQG